MAQNIFETLAKELSLKVDQVERTVALMDEGNTIPFISRSRTEVTGELDDTQLRKLEERLKYLRNIEARRVEVKNLIAAQEKLEKGFRVVTNCGKDACQSVSHLHFHILGGRQMTEQMA